MTTERLYWYLNELGKLILIVALFLALCGATALVIKYYLGRG